MNLLSPKIPKNQKISVKQKRIKEHDKEIKRLREEGYLSHQQQIRRIKPHLSDNGSLLPNKYLYWSHYEPLDFT